MSQTRPSYCGSVAITIEAFRNRPCTLVKTDPEYIPPTPEEVRSLRNLLGFPQARLGHFLGKSINLKGCKAVRRWETNVENKEYNPIDYYAWQMMLLAAGVITIQSRVDTSLGYKDVLNHRS